MDGDLAQYLRTRRTIPAAQLGEPGPDPETLRQMLTIAARVPDHGKLAPWRFIVFEREGRDSVIEGLTRIAGLADDEKERRYRADKAKGLADAPLIVGVVSAADRRPSQDSALGAAAFRRRRLPQSAARREGLRLFGAMADRLVRL